LEDPDVELDPKEKIKEKEIEMMEEALDKRNEAA